MHTRFRSSLISTALVALLLPIPTVAGAAGSPDASRLEGLVSGVDGRAAGGWHVHLIDDAGTGVARTDVDARGIYRFEAVTPGSYALAIESPEGRVAPVSAAPVRLAGGQLARRDVKLIESSAAERGLAINANYGLGQWWAGLSGAAKAWSVVGLLAVVGVTASALDDDDDPEVVGSPTGDLQLR